MSGSVPPILESRQKGVWCVSLPRTWLAQEGRKASSRVSKIILRVYIMYFTNCVYIIYFTICVHTIYDDSHSQSV